MNDTDFNKWISGETDNFFKPGKPTKGAWWIAIVVAVACVLSAIGFGMATLFSKPARLAATSANSARASLHSPKGSIPAQRVPAPPKPLTSDHTPQSRSDLTEQANALPGREYTRAAGAFMNSYWSSVEQSSDRVLPYLNSIYAPEVTYYGKMLPKQAVLRDKSYFLKHWPIRQTWQVGNSTISCKAAECEVTGVRRYVAINAARHASGWVRYSYGIRFAESGSPQIVAEDSQTIH